MILSSKLKLKIGINLRLIIIINTNFDLQKIYDIGK